MGGKELLDIYPDYLVSSFRQIVETGLLRLLDDAIRQERIQKLLTSQSKSENGLREVAKPYLRQA